MTQNKTLSIFDKTFKTSNIIVVFMFVLTALTGLVNQTILSAGVIVCCVALFLCNKLIYALPFVLFYNSFYGLVLGVSVFRAFSLLVICNAVIHSGFFTKIKLGQIIVFVLYLVYLIVAMIPAVGVASGLFPILDVMAVMILVSELTKNAEALLKPTFKIYVGVCLISFFSGIVARNSIGDEYNYSRFMATFEDPNYMGFFFTIAIFALVVLKLFGKRTRILLILTLYAMIFTTLSITAIVVNLAIWLVYLITTGRARIWFIPAIAVILLLVWSIYSYGLNNPGTPVLGELSARISEKLASLYTGDLGGATTGRLDLTIEHLRYYINLPILNVLFGGIPVNSKYIHPELHNAAHNEYVDMLLNVGIVGTVIMLGYFFSRLRSHIASYRGTKKSEELFFIIGKTIWIFYALSLTMFIDYRFMIMFLI